MKKRKQCVSVRGSKLKIPTRNVREDDALPPLASELTPRSYKVYPYALQELLEKEHCDREYETVILENENLELTVLPELGGRLLAYDKLRKRDLFFRNTELTPVMAGLTGAWSRIGCEFNFPGSHSVTSNRRVSCKGRENADGSASIVVSDIEWVSGMEWRIILTLRPESAIIEQESCYYNRTEVHNRGFFWTNAKIEAGDDSVIIFPPSCRKGAFHPPMDVTRIAVCDLPSVNGIDLSKLKEILFPLPLFMLDIRDHFFGCYRTERDEGLLHYADYGILPGRKLWSPGNGEDSKPVSQGGPPTFELQSGPLPLQTDFMFIAPGACNRWREFWVPIAGLGRHLFSSLKCSLGVRDGRLTVFSGTRLTEALVNISLGGRQVELALGSFAPGEAKTTDFTLSKPEDAVISVRSNGKELLRFAPGEQKPATLPEYSPAAEIHEDSVEALNLKGLYKQARGEDAKACELYSKALESDPSNSQALLLLGINSFKSWDFEKALILFEKALARNHRSAEISYYLGLCLLRKGDSLNARLYLRKASSDPAFRKPALAALAGLLMRQSGFQEALDILLEEIAGEDGSFCIRIENLALLETAMALAFKLGENALLKRLKHAVRLVSPDNVMFSSVEFLEEGILHDTSNPRLLIHAVLKYRSWGMLDFALKLATKVVELHDGNPIARYILAHLLDLEGLHDKANEQLYKAEKMPVAGIFPDSPYLLEVMESVTAAHPGCARAIYFQGLLYASLGAWEKAKLQWEKSISMGFESPFPYRCLGLFHWKRSGDIQKAAECYWKGFKLRSQDISYKYVYEMSIVLRALKDNSKRAELFAALPPALRDNPFVSMAYTQYLFDIGSYRELIKLLEDRSFSLHEGKRDTADIFIGSNTALGHDVFAKNDFVGAIRYFKKALSYPLRLGVGRSVGRHDMKTKYWLLKTLARSGEEAEARKLVAKFLAEADKYSFNYKKLKPIRWEEDNLEINSLMEENRNYEVRIKAEFGANQ